MFFLLFFFCELFYHFCKMTIVVRGILKNFWQPQKSTIRLRSKINIQKPRHPHFQRDKVEKLCLPFFPSRKNDPEFNLCKVITENNPPKIENPYQILLAKDVLNWFSKHNCIFIFQRNSIPGKEDLEARLQLKKVGLTCRIYGKSTLQKALTGTKFETTLVLFESHSLIGFGQDVNVKELLTVLKKIPKIVLLAGIFEDRLLSVSQLRAYSELPSLELLRAHLVLTLNSIGGNLTNQLKQSQSHLVQNLEQFLKISREKN